LNAAQLYFISLKYSREKKRLQDTPKQMHSGGDKFAELKA